MLNCVKWIEKIAYGKFESLSQDLTKIIPIFPENFKNFKNSCSFYETLGFHNSCLSFDPS